jgi:hypothetical protein
VARQVLHTYNRPATVNSLAKERVEALPRSLFATHLIHRPRKVRHMHTDVSEIAAAKSPISSMNANEEEQNRRGSVCSISSFCLPMPQKEQDAPSQFADASEQLPPLSSLELTVASASETCGDGSVVTCSSEPLLPRSSSRPQTACPLIRLVLVLAFNALLITTLLASIILTWKLRSSLHDPILRTESINYGHALQSCRAHDARKMTA